MEYKRIIASLISVVMGLAGRSALAQLAETANPPTEGLAEIIVTAQKREERLLDVANSVTAIEGTALAERQITDLTALAAQVPGLFFEQNGQGTDRVILRGQNAQGAGATVAIVVDDMPYNSSTSLNVGATMTTNLENYDLNRVEVLRGPQGTLYGAAAEGGLIKYVSNAPNLNQFEGAADIIGESVDHGSYGGAVKGVLNLPLIDGKFAMRLVGYSDRSPGYIDDPLTGRRNINDDIKSGGRIAFLFKPTEDLTFNFWARLQDLTNHSDGQVDVYGVPPSASLTNPPANQFDPVGGRFDRSSYLASYTKFHNVATAFSVDYDLKWATLTSITSFGLIRESSFNDISYGSPSNNSPPGANRADIFGQFVYGGRAPGTTGFAGGDIEQTKKYSEELRLTSSPGNELLGHALEWQGGLFYTREDFFFPFSLYALSFLPADFGRLLSPPPGTGTLYDKYKEYDAFGDVTYHFTSTFDVEAGVRSETNKQAHFVNLSGGWIFGAPGPATLQTNHSKETSTTYSIAPRYHLGADSIIYARVATGFRPGGPVSPIAGNPPGVPTEYHSDSTTNYEVGFRSAFFNRQFTMDVTLYRINWRDIQINTQFISPVSGLVFNVTGNAGTATSQGIEYAFNWLPAFVPGLSVSVVGSEVNAHLTQNAPGFGGINGERLAQVPESSNTLNVDYSRPLFADYRGFLGGSWSFIGTRYTDINPPSTNTLVHVELPTYNTLNVQGGARNDRWSFELYVHNANNSRGLFNYSSFAGYNNSGSAVFIQPRTIGVQLGAKF